MSEICSDEEFLKILKALNKKSEGNKHKKKKKKKNTRYISIIFSLKNNTSNSNIQNNSFLHRLSLKKSSINNHNNIISGWVIIQIKHN